MDEYVLTLFPLLHSTYQAINLTYQVLDVNCYEQQNVLKRWILPVKEESYECTCTPDFEEPEDMNVKGDNCILHGEISQRVVHRCVNLNEAMNSLGAPPELVKLLRTFHQYVNVADKLQLKRKCSKQSFLQKLNESNQYWHRAEPEPVMKLCLRYLLAFVNIIPKKKFEWSGINLKEMEEEFNLLSQSYNKRLDFNESLSENVFRVRKESELIVFENTAKKIHWALTGVWNRKCWSMFSGLKDMLKISYASKEDCLALHQKIQDIQKLQLQVEILIFLKNSFPFLSDLQNDHIALAHLYKSYSALCNISSVMVPVLLKN
ncbi:uncharacterized protein GBIM_15188 [Gryllus bimaculatus]|nr:uncharacterized protein GBIM_15188 [Gryllus bimaculatus]